MGSVYRWLVSWVDIVIAVIVLAATHRGYVVGVFRQVGTLVGLVSGFVVGVLFAPVIADHFSQDVTRPLVAAIVVGVCIVALAVLGRKVGDMANLTLRRLRLHRLDRVGGAAFAAAGSLLMCWLVASLLVNVSLGSISNAIATSKILAAVDEVMPPVPSVEAKVQALFRSVNFPSVFAAVVQPISPNYRLPSVATATATAAAGGASVFRITSDNACGVDREGTAFVVGPDEVVTAAHVVAGGRSFFVAFPDGSHFRDVAASLVEFDPDNDVAVLRVNDRGTNALDLSGSTPRGGTAAAVVGFPENVLVSRLTPATVAGTITAQGRDIYDDTLVTRPLVEVDANVEPGNSGSPVLVDGVVVGMIFSRSVAQNGVAYAVPSRIVAVDVARATGAPVITRTSCAAD
jgi:S1-C subfamily serine protease